MNSSDDVLDFPPLAVPSIAKFENKDGEGTERAYDMLVGADGVNSRVRSELEAQVPEFTVRQREVRSTRTRTKAMYISGILRGHGYFLSPALCNDCATGSSDV